MRTYAIFMTSTLPLLVTGVIAIIATSNNPSYTTAAVALLFSTIVFIFYSVLPVVVLSTIFFTGEIQLLEGTSERKVIIVSTTQMLILLVSFYTSLTDFGLIFPEAVCSVIFLSYFLLTVKNSGGLRVLLAKTRGWLFFPLMLYLGFIPLVYAYIHGLTVIESVYYASALSYIFATAMSSTNMLMADSEMLGPKS